MKQMLIDVLRTIGNAVLFSTSIFLFLVAISEWNIAWGVVFTLYNVYIFMAYKLGFRSGIEYWRKR